MATVFKTEKGRDSLCFDNYCYRYDKTGADGIMYWRCADQRQCRGRMATEPDYSNVSVRTPHCHLANPDRTIVRQVKTVLRSRSANEVTTPISTIYRQEMARLANVLTAAAMLPSYTGVKTITHKERKAIPLSRQVIVIPAEFQVNNFRNLIPCTLIFYFLKERVIYICAQCVGLHNCMYVYKCKFFVFVYTNYVQVGLYVCMYVCMYVYVCIYVCIRMYVCMCVYI